MIELEVMHDSGSDERKVSLAQFMNLILEQEVAFAWHQAEDFIEIVVVAWMQQRCIDAVASVDSDLVDVTMSYLCSWNHVFLFSQLAGLARDYLNPSQISKKGSGSIRRPDPITDFSKIRCGL